MQETNLHNNSYYLLVALLLALFGLLPLSGKAQDIQRREIRLQDKEALLKDLDKMLYNKQLSIEDANWMLAQLNRYRYDDIKDTLLINKVVELSLKVALLGYMSVSKQMALKAVAYFRKQGLLEREIGVQQLLVDVYVNESRIDSATWLLNQTERQWEAFSPGVPNPYILHSKALLAELEGRYLEASQYSVTALDLFKKRGNLMEVAVVHTTLGNVYIQMNMYGKALEYLLAAYDYFLEASIESRQLGTGLAIATTHKLAGAYQESLVWHRKNLALAKAMDNTVNLAIIYMNIGNTYNRLEKYPEALMYLDSSVMIAKAYGIEFGEFLYNLNKAAVLVKMNQAAAAIPLAEKVNAQLDVYGTPDINMEFYQVLSKAYQGVGRYEDALVYLQLSAGLKDSLHNQAAARFLLEWEGLMEKERKAREIAQLNEAIAKGKFQHRLMLGGSVAVILLMIFWFRMQFRINELKKKSIEEERQRLLIEVDHKNQALASKTIKSAAMGEAIADVSKQVQRLIPRVGRDGADKLAQILKDLEGMASNGDWQDFEVMFSQLHEDFFKQLYEVCPELTPTEIKICSLLRLNMSSKEISVLTNRTVATVDNHRAAIRKKLCLSPDESLTKYILSL